MTFGEQNTFPESFGLVDQSFLYGINFFDSTEMYPVVQRAQTQGRSQERRFGHLGCKMTWILDGPKCSNAKNITEAIDGSLSVFGLQTDYIDHWPDRFISRLVYTNGGDAILVLASNAIHFLWKWPKDLNSAGVATPKVHPNLWKPRSG
ncbi:unnamed protein product [Prunus armeniaca]